MALVAALLGTLILGSVVGVESHWELLILLALVAGVALVFDAATLHRARLRVAERVVRSGSSDGEHCGRRLDVERTFDQPPRRDTDDQR